MKKFFFQLKSNSPTDRIGQYGYQTVWTDKCLTKKEVKARYSSKNIHGHKVIAVYTEEQFIEKFGSNEAAKIKKYWLA